MGVPDEAAWAALPDAIRDFLDESSACDDDLMISDDGAHWRPFSEEAEARIRELERHIAKLEASLEENDNLVSQHLARIRELEEQWDKWQHARSIELLDPGAFKPHTLTVKHDESVRIINTDKP